ncbi:hypothetical protein BS47DRAFT_1394798 [Hydnum rufescens UP504]|uniref:Uncharacterized protein n=1 Tax=Hydnum rufescens UP504 TaxID=1448309 RepID=A0A9P6ATW9_9AGAM|nr:hypothetical protein BS47DRAFT_1394798 [Hydnum rufescens UP504]
MKSTVAPPPVFNGTVLTAMWQLCAGHAGLSANIKKVGSKLATRTILLALTEKGEIIQKELRCVGLLAPIHVIIKRVSSSCKQTFVVKQMMLLDLWMSAHRLPIDPTYFAILECKQSDEDDIPTEKADALQKEVDHTTTDSLPASSPLLRSSLEDLDDVLAPYRISFANAPIPEAKDAKRLDEKNGRNAKRFSKRCVALLKSPGIWSSITEHLSPPDTSELAESLDIEFDSEEHEALERGPLCQPPARHTVGTTGRTSKHRGSDGVVISSGASGCDGVSLLVHYFLIRVPNFCAVLRYFEAVKNDPVNHSGNISRDTQCGEDINDKPV